MFSMNGAVGRPGAEMERERTSMDWVTRAEPTEKGPVVSLYPTTLPPPPSVWTP